MTVAVAILGGGLAGLHAARLLHAAGVDAVVLEARDRLGGRILGADAAGIDLGPSWYWPEMQPRLDALVRELGIAAFPQHDEGDVLVERVPGRPPQQFQGFRQAPRSMRLVGGTVALVQALARDLPPDRVQLGRRVTGLALGAADVTLTLADGAEPLVARHVIAALPPRLLAATVEFAPPLPPEVLRLWRDTPTWMAPHAKFVALYERPFWREAGLSGMAQSMLGPLGEIHDATTADGTAALFGFVGLDAARRSAVGEERLVRACLDQLARLFGGEAGRPVTTLLKDWAADPLTATAHDRQGGVHPIPQSGAWVCGLWGEHLSLAGSEAGTTAPGYLAGALEAADRSVAETLERLSKGGPSTVSSDQALGSIA